MSIKRKILISAWLLAICYTNHAQKIGFWIDESVRKKSQTIPIEVIQNLPIITLKINNLFPRNFILDTGAKNTIHFNQLVMETLRRGLGRPVKIKGLGPSPEIDATLYPDISLQYENLKSANLSIISIDNFDLPINRVLGKEIHGIIGYELFKYFFVEIDYHKKYITLYEKAPKVNKRKWQEIPIRIIDGKPNMDLTVKDDNKTYNLNFLIDSGSSLGLSILPHNIAIPADDEVVKTVIGTGINGYLNGFINRTDELLIGKYQLKNLLSTFPDSMSVTHLRGTNSKAGSIGGEILKRFKIRIDYNNNKLYLKKNASYNSEFHFTKTGFMVEHNCVECENQVIITYIIPNTEAANLLMEGDEIIKINRHKLAHYSPLEINNMLLKYKIGKTIKLTILRQNKEMVISLPIKRII